MWEKIMKERADVSSDRLLARADDLPVGTA